MVRALILFCVAALGFLGAQAPRVGVIEFYGLRRVSEKHLRTALGFSEGGVLPASKGDVEDRLEKVSGVVRARIQAVCCTGDRAIVYVGIEEKEAPHFEFHADPAGDTVLPEEVLEAYRQYLSALEIATRAGPVAQNIAAEGHELSDDPRVRPLQEHFRELAKDHLELLRAAIRQSADPEQRAAAVYIVGYAATKRSVADDIQYALRDPDESVRANAIRALAAIAALGARDKELGIRVEPTWFVQMLNSLSWSDRTRATVALVGLTESRQPYVLDQIRDTGMASLGEMARWKTLDQALPAFIVLCRVAGIPEKEIQDAWAAGGRDKLIERALKPK